LRDTIISSPKGLAEAKMRMKAYIAVKWKAYIVMI